ncbi:MAG: exosortase family protein XrtG [Oscillospiraceae bacterium]
MNVIALICVLIWGYFLSVLKRAKLNFYFFLVGSVGIFIFMVIYVQPILTLPLTKLVAAAAGILGETTGMYTSFFDYAMLFIHNSEGSISLYIDYECSGIIEILAFVAMLWFFPVYNLMEKFVISIAGMLWIFASNLIRIFLICTLIYFFGNDMFFFAHTIFGRIVFYGLSILLYFYVFTKSQVVRQKVGNFNYGNNI